MGVYYDCAFGGAIVEINADLDQVAAIEAHIDADYVSFWMDPMTEELHVRLDLNAAHLTLDDRGGWAMATRILPANM